MITRMSGFDGEQTGDTRGASNTDSKEFPLSVMMIGVIVATCVVYALFAIFLDP